MNLKAAYLKRLLNRKPPRRWTSPFVLIASEQLVGNRRCWRFQIESFQPLASWTNNDSPLSSSWHWEQANCSSTASLSIPIIPLDLQVPVKGWCHYLGMKIMDTLKLLRIVLVMSTEQIASQGKSCRGSYSLEWNRVKRYDRAWLRRVGLFQLLD